MKITGLLLSTAGFLGLTAGAVLEFSTGSGLDRLINYGLVSALLDHRMLIVLVSGFALVAGAVLYGFALTQEALGRMTAMIGAAIDAPDSCPAMPLLLNTPAGPTADVTALRPAPAVAPGGTILKMMPESIVPDTGPRDGIAREGGIRGA
ncbi:hypothetical protein JL100_009205 [Skermanella mucosa]|uniref:hypothetical protein n=1 Tax=Skermanella mucosa TaxID=1789672 RepID=UPI00192BA671|nr:hypothetical protein [Skermanella mucosa]UEM22899.1 hypothetical protein JL100_009205 [Skermanella mucosa]